ncbi:RrF2 family transcriptional regulator [Aeoliella sp.]|uniref:RrF2 family transcriptional regulator n=1 Tax=Aeoliella sp. TaxID=2795800 RepID=UPI003CCC428C
MVVSRSLAYAIQSLIQLADTDCRKPVSCRVLANHGSLPERFLLQILRKLVGHGVLKSVRGVEGGYLLARSADSITLLDLYEALDSPIVPSVPPLPAVDPYTHTKLHETMLRAADLVNHELSQVSLSDLIDSRPVGIEGQLCLPVWDTA